MNITELFTCWGFPGPVGKGHMLKAGGSGELTSLPQKSSCQALAPSLHWSLHREASSILCRFEAAETHLCHCTFLSSSISLGLPVIAAELLGSTYRRPKLT